MRGKAESETSSAFNHPSRVGASVALWRIQRPLWHPCRCLPFLSSHSVCERTGAVNRGSNDSLHFTRLPLQTIIQKEKDATERFH